MELTGEWIYSSIGMIATLLFAAAAATGLVLFVARSAMGLFDQDRSLERVESFDDRRQVRSMGASDERAGGARTVEKEEPAAPARTPSGLHGRH